MSPTAEVGELRIWALLGARAGDNDQVLALAEATGLPFEVKPLQYTSLNRLGPALLGRSLASLTSASRTDILAEEPPHLTISTGHRSVPVVRRLLQRSVGRMRSIHIGFPRVAPSHFDLVIVPPQYAAADAPNLIRIPLALTRAAMTARSAEPSPELDKLPSPRRLLIVGGPTLFWDLDEQRLLTNLDRLLNEARVDGGSVLVTTSPRTPAAMAARLQSILDGSAVPTLLARPRQPPSYGSLLTAADTIHITADSVSMISDAIWTGKPLAIVPVVHSPLGRAAFALNDRLRPGARVYPQDLRFFWRALAAMGIGEQLATPGSMPHELLDEVLGRVRPVIEQVRLCAAVY